MSLLWICRHTEGLSQNPNLCNIEFSCIFPNLSCSRKLAHWITNVKAVVLNLFDSIFLVLAMKKQSYYFSFLMKLRVQIYQITLACIIFAEWNTILFFFFLLILGCWFKKSASFSPAVFWKYKNLFGRIFAFVKLWSLVFYQFSADFHIYRWLWR